MSFLSGETSALATQAMSEKKGRGTGGDPISSDLMSHQGEVEKEANEEDREAALLTGRRVGQLSAVDRVTFGESGARCVCFLHIIKSDPYYT